MGHTTAAPWSRRLGMRSRAEPRVRPARPRRCPAVLDLAAVTWRIHSGPFPYIVDAGGQVWLWRITDGHHYTSTTVRFWLGEHDDVQRIGQGVSGVVEAALRSRGRAAVEGCLPWTEPPREITFSGPAAPPEFWSGRR